MTEEHVAIKASFSKQNIEKIFITFDFIIVNVK